MSRTYLNPSFLPRRIITFLLFAVFLCIIRLDDDDDDDAPSARRSITIRFAAAPI